MTVHVANAVSEFLEEVKKGFKKVRWITLSNQTPTKPEEGEQTQEEFEEMIKNFASFQAIPDLEGNSFFDRDENDYNTREIDHYGFRSDFQKELQKKLGDDVLIHHCSGTDEYECQRVDGYSYLKTLEPRVEYFGKYPVKLLKQACIDLTERMNNDTFTEVPKSYKELVLLFDLDVDENDILLIEATIKNLAVRMVAQRS